MKNTLITFHFLILIFVSCQNKQDERTVEHVITTGPMTSDNSLSDLIERGGLSEISSVGGWVNLGSGYYATEIFGTPEENLNDVGQIAFVKKVGDSIRIEILRNHIRIPDFNFEEHISIPKITPRKFTMLDSAKAADVNILGIGGSINRQESLKYEEKIVMYSHLQ